MVCVLIILTFQIIIHLIHHSIELEMESWLYLLVVISWLGFPGGSVVKNLPANAGDVVSIPGSERSLEKDMATHSSHLAWRIQWTEEPGRLQSMESEKSWTQFSD